MEVSGKYFDFIAKKRRKRFNFFRKIWGPFGEGDELCHPLPLVMIAR